MSHRCPPTCHRCPDLDDDVANRSLPAEDNAAARIAVLEARLTELEARL
ncbi:hypothetical protein [Streptomyces anulatus]